MNIQKSIDQQIADLIKIGQNITYPAFNDLKPCQRIQATFTTLIDQLLPHNAIISLYYHGIDQPFANPLLDDEPQITWYNNHHDQFTYFIKLDAYNKHDFPIQLQFATPRIQQALTTKQPTFELGYTFKLDHDQFVPLNCQTTYKIDTLNHTYRIPLPLHPNLKQYPSLTPSVIAKTINQQHYTLYDFLNN